MQRPTPVRNVVHATGHVVGHVAQVGFQTAANVAAIPVRVIAAPIRYISAPRYYYPHQVHHSVIVNQSYQGCASGFCNPRGR